MIYFLQIEGKIYLLEREKRKILNLYLFFIKYFNFYN